MTQQIFHTAQCTVRIVLLLLVLWAVAAPRATAILWTAVVPPRGPAPQPYLTIQPFPGASADPEILNAIAPPDMTLPLSGVGIGKCCLPRIPLPVQPTTIWPAPYPSHIVAGDDPSRWVACLNAHNAARLSRLFGIAGAPSNVMGLLPGTSDPCDEASPGPMGWTPGWNLPDPRPAYIIREGHVLITVPDWGGPR